MSFAARSCSNSGVIYGAAGSSEDADCGIYCVVGKFEVPASNCDQLLTGSQTRQAGRPNLFRHAARVINYVGGAGKNIT